MAPIKCVGCWDLKREELDLSGKHLVVYNCPPYFPYACALSGLFQATSGIVEAIKDCPRQPGLHCILISPQCSGRLSHFGIREICMCSNHDNLWGKWLDAHPERAAYFSPKGRLRSPNWVEVFREFIEDMRRKP